MLDKLIDYLLSNLFEFPYLIKLKNNKGILFGFKETALRNYIDVSSYFSKVYFANFNNASYRKMNSSTTVSLLKVTSDMKVIFHSPSSYNENPTDEVFLSVTYFIVGELK